VLRKSPLDEAQSGRIVRIAFRQGHDDVQVIGQHYSGVNRERMPIANVTGSRTQCVDMINEDT